jgi:hypothetical protein
LGLRGAANNPVLLRLPVLIGSQRDLGACWLGHGVAATRRLHSSMPLLKHVYIEREREQIKSSLEAFRRDARQAQEWLSQDWGTSVHTFGLLAGE